MKKIITFAIALFSFSAIFAQSRHDHNDRNDRFGNYNNSRDVTYGRNNNYNNVYNYPSKGNYDRYDDQRR